MKVKAGNSRFCVTALVALFFLTIPGSAFARQQKRLALVIGNADYMNAPVLRNPVNDARAMAARLAQLHFKVIRVLNGTYRQMLTSLNEFADELNRYDVALFYYSGHGVQYQGTNYLVPVNANIQRAVDIEFEALNATRVLADMESSGTQVNIMILDACRNNPFASQFRSLTRGLSVVQAPAGSLVVYSTAPDQVALDGSGKHSPFTAALLGHIETPGVSIQDMLTEVFQQVQQKTHGEQIPWESSSLTVPFYFAPKLPEIAASPKPAEPASRKAASPGSAGPSLNAASVGTGRLTIDVKPKTYSPVPIRVLINGPTSKKIQTMESLLDFVEPITMSLPPGHYLVSVKFSNDMGTPYTKAVSVRAGRSVNLQMPVNYSSRYMTRTKITLLQSERNRWAENLRSIRHTRAARGGLGGFFTAAGLGSGVGAALFAISALRLYSAYQTAQSMSDASLYSAALSENRFGLLATAIGGGVSLLLGVVLLSTLPSTKDAVDSIQRLNAQLAAVAASGGSGD